MTWVGFPQLGIDRLYICPYINIFGVTIYWYGIIIAIGMSLSVLYAFVCAHKFGIDKNKMIDVIIIGIVFGICGARAYYVIFSFDSFSDNFLKIFDLRGGGLAIYGGIICAFIFGFIACRYKKIKFLPLADIASLGFLLGQGIGRWGNFVNVEAYGSQTDLPWGMTSNKIPIEIQPAHPTFLYESIWCILGFIIFNLLMKYRKFDGQILLMYFTWYGFERFFVEGLRTDSLWLIPNIVRVSQLISIILLVVSMTILIYILFFYMKKHSDREYLYVNTNEYKNNLVKSEKD